MSATVGATQAQPQHEPQPGPIPVLLYHSVADSPPPGQLREFTVTPERFREHIAVITAAGFTAMTISALARALNGAEPLPPRPLAITFDDGFEDTPAAVQALSDVGLPATVYVTAGTIGTPAGISVAALVQLAAGCEIGAHSVSHPHLDELPLALAAREITESRDQLEQHLGSPVASFAYPHGAYDRSVRASVIEAGFSSAAAVKNALSHRRDDPFAIARWTVTYPTSAAELGRVLDGSGVPLAWSRERHRTRASRTARRLRRRIDTRRKNRRGPGSSSA
jgi:peptidoglycan/xylan/chitin deacetylase (PgdA/CDA1 family)